MWRRYLLTMPVGTAVTFGLLFVMQFLIQSGVEAKTEPRDAPTLDFVKLEESEVRTQELLPPTPIDPPRNPPPLNPPVIDDPGPGVVVHRLPPTDPGPGHRGPITGPMADGPLVAMIRVAPQYPPMLQNRGIEGWAIIGFDVEADGSVSNIHLIDASHAGFAKPAMRAAERFRYKARVVDGQPVPTRGVSNRFRFNLEN